MKSSKWLLTKKWKQEQFTDRWRDWQTDGRRLQSIRKAHWYFQLRWAKNGKPWVLTNFACFIVSRESLWWDVKSLVPNVNNNYLDCGVYWPISWSPSTLNSETSVLWIARDIQERTRYQVLVIVVHWSIQT